MKIVCAGILGAVMGIGGYVLYHASVSALAEDAAKDMHIAHCKTVNALVIAEFDAIVNRGKFPTQDQQDRWRQLSLNCEW